MAWAMAVGCYYCCSQLVVLSVVSLCNVVVHHLFCWTGGGGYESAASPWVEEDKRKMLGSTYARSYSTTTCTVDVFWICCTCLCSSFGRYSSLGVCHSFVCEIKVGLGLCLCVSVCCLFVLNILLCVFGRSRGVYLSSCYFYLTSGSRNGRAGVRSRPCSGDTCWRAVCLFRPRLGWWHISAPISPWRSPSTAPRDIWP